MAALDYIQPCPVLSALFDGQEVFAPLLTHNNLWTNTQYAKAPVLSFQVNRELYRLKEAGKVAQIETGSKPLWGYISQ